MRHNLYTIVFTSLVTSVKPFKSKNLDKIYLDAPNPNLKKDSDGDSRATVATV